MRTPFADSSRRATPLNASAPPAIVRPDDEIIVSPSSTAASSIAAAWMRRGRLRARRRRRHHDRRRDRAPDRQPRPRVTLGLPQVCLPSTEPSTVRSRLARALGVTRVVAVAPDDGVPASPRRSSRLLYSREAARRSAAGGAGRGTGGDDAVHHELGIDRRAEADRAERPRARRTASGTRELSRRTSGICLLVTVEDIFRASRRASIARGAAPPRCSGPTAVTPASAIGAFCATQRVTRLRVGVLQAARHGAATVPARCPRGSDVYVGGARVPMRLRDAYGALRRRAPPRRVRNARGRHGLHDLSGRSAMRPLESVGPPVAGADDRSRRCRTGGKLPDGEIGEVRLRTTNMIHAYPMDPVATARHFRDGWFHTGDLGSFTSARIAVPARQARRHDESERHQDLSGGDRARSRKRSGGQDRSGVRAALERARSRSPSRPSSGKATRGPTWRT